MIVVALTDGSLTDAAVLDAAPTGSEGATAGSEAGA